MMALLRLGTVPRMGRLPAEPAGCRRRVGCRRPGRSTPAAPIACAPALDVVAPRPHPCLPRTCHPSLRRTPTAGGREPGGAQRLRYHHQQPGPARQAVPAPDLRYHQVAPQQQVGQDPAAGAAGGQAQSAGRGRGAGPCSGSALHQGEGCPAGLPACLHCVRAAAPQAWKPGNPARPGTRVPPRTIVRHPPANAPALSLAAPQAADLISRIAPVMKKCDEEKLLAHLGVVLYENLGEEYPGARACSPWERSTRVRGPAAPGRGVPGCAGLQPRLLPPSVPLGAAGPVPHTRRACLAAAAARRPRTRVRGARGTGRGRRCRPPLCSPSHTRARRPAPQRCWARSWERSRASST